MDPFSILTGTTSLLDVLWRCGSYLKHVHDSAGKIDEDIAALTHEIDALISVNTSIDDAFKAEHSRIPDPPPADSKRVESLWRNVGTLLRDCQATVEQLEVVVQEIVGKGRSSKSLDAIKKTLRKDKKIDEFKDLRLQLMNYRNSLQVLLTALNLCVERFYKALDLR